MKELNNIKQRAQCALKSEKQSRTKSVETEANRLQSGDEEEEKQDGAPVLDANYVSPFQLEVKRVLRIFTTEFPTLAGISSRPSQFTANVRQ